MADPSKTESATPKRKEEARKKGQVARSSELNTALGILGSLAVFELASHFMMEELGRIGTQAWGNLNGHDIGLSQIDHYSYVFVFELVYLLFPLLVGVMLLGILTNVLQVGFLLSAETLTIKLEHLNPIRGFGRIFSRRTAVEILKGLLKVAIVAWVAWGLISAKIEPLMGLMSTDVPLFYAALGDFTGALVLRIGLALLVLGLLDYWYQRYEYEDRLKMTKQEVKDELRQMEGDPQVKARIRRLQQEASRRRMLAEIPTADVVITNPTHLAVAIRYDLEKLDKPQVIAKGSRFLAERIKEIAKDNGIPVLENKPLARALYENVPVGAAIPAPFFNAVAELLAFVYKMQGTMEEKVRRQQAYIARKGGLVLSPEADNNR